jgi:hypothetical protein
MARDYYITYSQADKLALLAGVEKARNTGQVTRVQTSHGVFTDFDAGQADLSDVHQKLCYSIAVSKDFDPNDPVQCECRKNLRVGVTRTRYTM